MCINDRAEESYVHGSCANSVKSSESCMYGVVSLKMENTLWVVVTWGVDATGFKSTGPGIAFDAPAVEKSIMALDGPAPEVLVV
jgi:hypothetical protein